MRADVEQPFVGSAPISAAMFAPASRIGRLERLPKWLNLLPIVAQWIWLSLRYRSITLPSCCNPAITSGGMVGEGKLEYFKIMGPRAMRATATTVSAVADGIESIDAVEMAMKRAGLAYPIVVKPDLGWCGFGVRRIDDRFGLIKYLDAYPRGERIVVQQWMDEACEAGVFYMRHPGQQAGQVIGMLLRHFPRVTGDGVHSIAELIAADARASRLGRDGASEPCCDATRIPKIGQAVRIAVVASTRVGGMYEDGTALVTTALCQAFDAICHDMKDFHVGRFDVKFKSLASLCAGTGFTIIEVNGAGSEAVHAWDPSLTLRQAYRIIFDKQRRLFAIGDEMRCLGHAPVGWWALARHHLRQQALIRRYPPSN
ncbi:MAG: hypothetical protein ABI831_18670 [Betaproteobacteria bacterium]